MSIMEPGTQTAGSVVAQNAQELDLTAETEAKAIQLAERAQFEHAINADNQSLAAGAIYAAGLLANQKLTQEEVSDATGRAVTTIRRQYQPILVHEGYVSREQDETEKQENEESVSVLKQLGQKMRQVISG